MIQPNVVLIGLCDHNTALIQKAIDEISVYHHLQTAKERENCLCLTSEFIFDLRHGENGEFDAVHLWASIAWAKLLLSKMGEIEFSQVEYEVKNSLENALDNLLKYRYSLKNC